MRLKGRSIKKFQKLGEGKYVHVQYMGGRRQLLPYPSYQSENNNIS